MIYENLKSFINCLSISYNQVFVLYSNSVAILYLLTDTNDKLYYFPCSGRGIPIFVITFKVMS